jgi:hypothetical protein
MEVDAAAASEIVAAGPSSAPKTTRCAESRSVAVMRSLCRVFEKSLLRPGGLRRERCQCSVPSVV